MSLEGMRLAAQTPSEPPWLNSSPLAFLSLLEKAQSLL